MSRPHLGLALWGTEPVPVLVRQVQLAEAIGFESVWIIDSQLICREVYVTLAACLAGTTRIKLAPGVTQPRTRHVSVTASALATLEEMAPGRVMAGVGTGFSSLRTLGMAAARVDEIDRYVTTLRRLLARQHVDFDAGVSGRLAWADRAMPVPVVIAASGPRITRLAGRVADGAILLQGVAPDLLARGLDWLNAGAASAGLDPASLDVTCWTPLGLGASAAAGRDEVRARVASAVMQADPESFQGEERDAVLRLRATYDDFKHAESKPDHAALISDRMVERYAVAGAPAEIAAQLSALMATPGLDRVVLTPQGGATPLEDVLRTLEREVLPKL